MNIMEVGGMNVNGSAVFHLLKVALPFANYIVCHFGATYIDGSTGDPPIFILDILRRPDNESLCKVS